MKKNTKIIIALITAAALSVTAIVAYLSYQAGQSNRIEDKYNSQLHNILKYHKEEHISYAIAKDSFNYLNDYINDRYQEKSPDHQKHRNEIASKLVTSFEDGSFDFEKYRHLQLELLSLDVWPEYPELLIANPKANMEILFKYGNALKNLREKNPELIRTATTEGGKIKITFMPNDENTWKLLRDLIDGYSKHFDLLKSTLNNNPEQGNKDNILQAFCLFNYAVDNAILAKQVFKYTDRVLEAEKARCASAGLLTK